MFLFTTTSPGQGAARPGDPAGPVVDAIRQGASKTGTSFDYLLSTAKRESALDPAAKAGTSSATGLFQFIEQTWLGLLRSEGDKLGLGSFAGAIEARSDGTFAVPDPQARQAILKLREDPSVASVLAGALTQQNRAYLAAATGREPGGGDLYAAHVLGARGASDLIRAATDNPQRAAALDFPEAAAANRGIFYDKAGRPRGAAEVYQVLAAQAANAPAAVPADTATSVLPTLSGPPLQGLFQTGNRAGPVSDAVSKLWRVNQSNVAGEKAGPLVPFFPRSGETASAGDAAPSSTATVAATEPSSAAASTSAPNVPLPPPRPRLEAAGPSGSARPDAAPLKARRRS